MKFLNTINKFVAVAFLATVMPFVLGASTITGTSEESKKSSKYSLSNLNLYSKKAVNFSLLKTPSLYNGSTVLLQQNNTQGGIQLNTSIQFNKGNCYDQD